MDGEKITLRPVQGRNRTGAFQGEEEVNSGMDSEHCSSSSLPSSESSLGTFPKGIFYACQLEVRILETKLLASIDKS